MRTSGLTGTIHRWLLNRSLNSKLILIFSIPFLFLVMVSLTTLLVFKEFDAAEHLVERSDQIQQQVIYNLELLFSMQNAFRGYVLTGDSVFRSLYNESKGDIDLAGFELARLVQDSPLQSQRDLVEDVQTVTRRLIAEKDGIIARVENGAREEGIAYVKSGRGQELVGMISSLLTLFQSVATQIQKERQAAVEVKRTVVLRMIIGGTVLTLLMTGLGVVIVARSVTKPMSSLAKAAREIGESRYAVFPDADRQDEVGVLSRSMEEMQRRLIPAERLATLTRMATSIAHDLRTPLLGIEQGLQGLQYVADPQLTPETRQFVGDLHTGARLAVGIVQDILDLYRQAYGDLPLSYSRFKLDELAREAIELMSAEVRDRRLSISLEGTAPVVSADRRRLFRVLVNLLDNAVKNSPKGGHVRVLITDQGEDRSRRAVVAVEDEGRGLDPTDLDTLFEPSRPVSAPTRGGTGLGLYLCRLVVGAHHGIISAQNRSEGGARFVFDVPAEASHVHSTSDSRRPASVQAEPSSGS